MIAWAGAWGGRSSEAPRRRAASHAGFFLKHGTGTHFTFNVRVILRRFTEFSIRRRKMSPLPPLPSEQMPGVTSNTRLRWNGAEALAPRAAPVPRSRSLATAFHARPPWKPFGLFPVCPERAPSTQDAGFQAAFYLCSVPWLSLPSSGSFQAQTGGRSPCACDPTASSASRRRECLWRM